MRFRETIPPRTVGSASSSIPILQMQRIMLRYWHGLMTQTPTPVTLHRRHCIGRGRNRGPKWTVLPESGVTVWDERPRSGPTNVGHRTVRDNLKVTLC